MAPEGCFAPVAIGAAASSARSWTIRSGWRRSTTAPVPRAFVAPPPHRTWSQRAADADHAGVRPGRRALARRPGGYVPRWAFLRVPLRTRSVPHGHTIRMPPPTQRRVRHVGVPALVAPQEARDPYPASTPPRPSFATLRPDRNPIDQQSSPGPGDVPPHARSTALLTTFARSTTSLPTSSSGFPSSRS